MQIQMCGYIYRRNCLYENGFFTTGIHIVIISETGYVTIISVQEGGTTTGKSSGVLPSLLLSIEAPNTRCLYRNEMIFNTQTNFL